MHSVIPIVILTNPGGCSLKRFTAVFRTGYRRMAIHYIYLSKQIAHNWHSSNNILAHFKLRKARGLRHLYILSASKVSKNKKEKYSACNVSYVRC